MRKYLLALLLALLVVVPAGSRAQLLPQGPVGLAYCTQTFQVSQGAVALTKIISNVSGKTIYICGWTLDGGTVASTVQFEYGTGTNCATGTTALTPSLSVNVGQYSWDHLTYATMTVPAGNDLCLVTTGAGPTGIILYYAQF